MHEALDSIRRRLLPSAHPDDGDLMAVAALGASAGPVSRDIERHLASCPDCVDRTDALVASFDTLSTDLDAEVDALFPPARLERQRQSILRHLEPDREPGRVLRFPGPLRLSRRAPGQVARRWVAAAAVAGLFVGVFAGRLLDPPRWHPTRPAAAVAFAPALGAHPAPVPGGAPNDEAFLVELDAAVFSPRIEPLRTLDALTPRVTTVSVR